MEKIEEELNKEKPRFLYHGSPHMIKELEPRTKPHREKEGNLVFATSEIADASMFLYKTSLTGHFLIGGENVAYALIVGDREQVLKEDKGGHIHVLSSETFEPSPHTGMSNEWTSKKPVKPIKTIEYSSAIDAMLESGVQLYFVDEAMYRETRNSKDHGYSIFKSLQSENQRRGINVKELR